MTQELYENKYNLNENFFLIECSGCDILNNEVEVLVRIFVHDNLIKWIRFLGWSYSL